LIKERGVYIEYKAREKPEIEINVDIIGKLKRKI